ncbi:hypothetical protein [Fictibacillus sp. BK138]|uniref:hypothetical protein n=1 Tax=Fictibacillus sp. BK138 TaxID=2512121 RepID=UPI00102883C6|nr:hypothetical protein [Fictibacillus sp. BK138]RZT23789.1 hypothetical protein EV282_2885 [Fictibacillus sp. BK138]
MKKIGGKLKPFAIPILFFLLVFSILTNQNLQIELELPAEGWSRSLSLDAGNSGEVKPVFIQENSQQHVYVPKENEVLSFTVNSDLEVKNKKTTPISIPSPQNFWAKENQFVYVKNKQLINFDGNKENLLDDEVFGMDANQEKIIYFKEHEILSLEPGTWNIKTIDKVKERLEAVVLNETSQSFLASGVITGDTKKAKAVFYQFKDSSYKKHEVINKEELLTQNHFGFYFIEKGLDITIYYSLFQNASGGKSYYIFKGTNQLDSGEKWTFNKMTFQDKNGIKLENPKHLQYGVDENNQAKVLFTTRAMKSHEKEAVNVYEAYQKGDVWLTERRSTTNNGSLHAHWIDERSMVWMNMISQKEFTFSGASSNPDIIEKSLVKTKEDYKQAISTTILTLFQGLVLAMSALFWITPAVLFALLVYLVKISLIEGEDKRVMFTILALYLGVQLIFIQKLFNEHYYYFAPDFLTFSGSSVIIPLVLSVLSGVAVMFGKKKDWSMIVSICYFVVVNITFLSLTVGPYMF